MVNGPGKENTKHQGPEASVLEERQMVKAPQVTGRTWAFTLSEMESRRSLSREGQSGAQSFFGYMGGREMVMAGRPRRMPRIQLFEL